MRLHEVGNNHRRTIRELADNIVRVWGKDDISREDIHWLTLLSSDDHLVAKLFKGSLRYETYGGEGNEPFLDSAATYAKAYSILTGFQGD